MRWKLKQARLARGMTQQQVAEYLHISARYYKALESGERVGGIEFWDRLEDLFSIHQRVLREIHPDKEGNQ